MGPRIRLEAEGPFCIVIIPYNISFQKSIIGTVQFTFPWSRKNGEDEKRDLLIEALHRLQETIYCMFHDKIATAIQLALNVQ